jgi:hypothetical protein
MTMGGDSTWGWIRHGVGQRENNVQALCGLTFTKPDRAHRHHQRCILYLTCTAAKASMPKMARARVSQSAYLPTFLLNVQLLL